MGWRLLPVDSLEPNRRSRAPLAFGRLEWLLALAILRLEHVADRREGRVDVTQGDPNAEFADMIATPIQGCSTQ